VIAARSRATVHRMAHVDVDDDSIVRYVVCHYRLDPERHERRHVVVGVYDNEPEMRRHITAIGAVLAQRRADGERVDRREHGSGSPIAPGDRERAANAHVVRRALEHGVPPDRLRARELLSSMVLLGPTRAESRSTAEPATRSAPSQAVPTGQAAATSATRRARTRRLPRRPG
jgi:hypothetical protein